MGEPSRGLPQALGQVGEDEPGLAPGLEGRAQAADEADRVREAP